MTNSPETVYLLGAGFTKAAFPDAPLNSELLALLTKDGKSELARVASESNLKTSEIEKILTEFDLKEATVSALSQRRLKVSAEIGRFFEQFRFNKDVVERNDWIEEFATKTLRANDFIISLNYDCLLEGALDYFDVWRPSTGYSSLYHPLFGDNKSELNPQNITIAKIHGSEHFAEASDYGDEYLSYLKFEVNESIFPKSGKNRHFLRGTSLKSDIYIVAPSFVKQPHIGLINMMLDSLRAMSTASNFVIIGCSMRREDQFLWLLLTKFLETRDVDGQRKIIIIAPNASLISTLIYQFGIPPRLNWWDTILINCGVGIDGAISRLGESLN